jgi:hypothetical protein
MNHVSDDDVLITARKITKLSTSIILCTFPESVPTRVSIEFSDDRSLRTDYVQRLNLN